MPYIGNNIRSADDYRLIDDISSGFNGSATTFALQVGGSSPVPFPKTPQQCLISVNGVIQEPDPTGNSGFTLTGTNIVFSSAPTNGHSFFGIIYATADYLNAGGTFPDGAVGNPSITFTNDDDTGLYKKGSGAIGFVSNGVEITSVDGDGFTIADSIIHGGDTNTKIRFPAADTFSVNTAGAERFRIDSSGKVGIGVTNPDRELDISNSSGNCTISLRSSDSHTTQLLFGDVSAELRGRVGYSSSDNLDFYTAANERMRIDSSGRLLINTSAQSTGTNSANAILTVNSQVGNATSAAILALRRGQASASISQNNTLGRIVFCDSQAGEYAFIEGEADLGSNGVGDTAGRIAFSTSADGSSAPTERMRIDSNGAVHIKSAGTSYLGFTGSGDAGIIVGNGSVSDAGLQIRTSSSGTCRVNFGDGDGSSSERSRGFIHYTHSDDSMQIGANSSERMRIDSSGRVGIGTTSPQEILHVKAASEAINTRDGVIFGSTDLLAADKGLPLVWTANIGTDADYGIASICGRKENATSDNGAGYLQFGTGNGPGAISERMRIDSLGNVGIGTTTPTGSNAGYNGALLHLHQTNSSLAGSQVHLTTGVSGQGIADGSIIAQWSDNNLYINNQENAAIRFFTNNGDRARIDADGLKLDGNTAAANALNDYEEGTFSATASAAGYSGGSAIAMADESYTKIGNMVYFNMRLQVASSLSDGDLTITGLPFTASQDSVVNFSWQDAASFNGGQGKISGTQCVRFNGTFPTHHTGTANIIFEGTYRTNS